MLAIVELSVEPVPLALESALVEPVALEPVDAKPPVVLLWEGELVEDEDGEVEEVEPVLSVLATPLLELCEEGDVVDVPLVLLDGELLEDVSVLAKPPLLLELVDGDVDVLDGEDDEMRSLLDCDDWSPKVPDVDAFCDVLLLAIEPDCALVSDDVPVWPVLLWPVELVDGDVVVSLALVYPVLPLIAPVAEPLTEPLVLWFWVEYAPEEEGEEADVPVFADALL